MPSAPRPLPSALTVSGPLGERDLLRAVKVMEKAAGEIAMRVKHDYLKQYFQRRAFELAMTRSWLKKLVPEDHTDEPVHSFQCDGEEECVTYFLKLTRAYDALARELLAHDRLNPFLSSSLCSELKELSRHRRCLQALQASLKLHQSA